jgi:hypothetical protein
LVSPPSTLRSGTADPIIRANRRIAYGIVLSSLARFTYQRVRKRHNVNDRGVSLAALDSADAVAVQVGYFGQLLLGQTSFESQRANLFSENDS